MPGPQRTQGARGQPARAQPGIWGWADGKAVRLPAESWLSDAGWAGWGRGRTAGTQDRTTRHKGQRAPQAPHTSPSEGPGTRRRGLALTWH